MSRKQAITRAEGRNGARGLSIPAAYAERLKDALDPSHRAGPVKTWAQMTEQEREEVRRQTQRGYTVIELMFTIVFVVVCIIIVLVLFKGAMMIVMGTQCK